MLEEMAAMLELKGENPFKVRAYENGAHAILGFQGDLDGAVRSGEIRQVKGIGPGLFANLETLRKTGSLPYYDELRTAFPPGLRECLRIPGFSPRKAKRVHDALGVDSLAALENACLDGRITSLTGFGAKSVEKILKGIAMVRAGAGLHKYSRAMARAQDVLLALKGPAPRVELAGGLRRRCEVVSTADFVAESAAPRGILDAFSSIPGAAESLPPEEGVARVRLAEGLVITLRTASRPEFAAALLDATGNPAHVEALRARARERGLRLEPSGLFRGNSNRRVACATEAEIYAALDLAWVEPELREGRGEVESAARRDLPKLVTRQDLRGLIHVHTTESDGRDSLEDMLAAVRDAGYEWVAITDHSQTAGYAGGLTPERVLRQRAAIAAIRPRFPDLTIFHGTEADILADGSIDFGDEFLEGFDVVVASVHSRFGLEKKEQTARLIRAVRNRRVTVLGHPTGRLLLSRNPIDVDVEAVLDAAAQSGCAVEINCSPDRLDLDWRFCQGAVLRGIPMAIDPDAHSVGEIGLVPYGINIARKGWVTAESTLNARTAEYFAAWLAIRRAG